jgi:hypothetical protein
VKAFKFLAAGATGRFSRHSWSTPQGSEPGAWVEVTGSLRPCTQGIHACRKSDLAYWLDDELWCIELGGEIVHGKTMVVSRRGRLIERVGRWESALRSELARFCCDRTTAAAAQAMAEAHPEAALAQRFADDVVALAGLGQLATAAYVSAVAARFTSDLSAEQAYAAERAAQSDWLAERVV